MMKKITYLLALVIFTGMLNAEDIKLGEYRIEPGKFPDITKGKYLSGELVMVDPINRRAALRLDGDGVENRYDKAAATRIAMLPYGSIWYNGAQAELRDIPIGTHVHGIFYLPPKGDNSIPEYEGRNENKKYASPYTHCMLLEDDFSYYENRKISWKIKKILPETTVKVSKHGGIFDTTVPAKIVLKVDGKQENQRSKEELIFSIDDSTVVWKNNRLSSIRDLKPDDDIQFNLTWGPEWSLGKFHCAEIWADKESRSSFTKKQQEKYKRYLHYYWLPGIIEKVEYQEPGKKYEVHPPYKPRTGKQNHGILTVTLFDNCGQSYIKQIKETFKKPVQCSIAPAENTLRVWIQPELSSCRVLDVKLIENPVPGSSGIQLRLWLNSDLREAHRKGRIIRFRPVIPSTKNSWKVNMLPPEFRIRTPQQRFSQFKTDF